MSNEIISLRVGRELRNRMRMHRYINWSAIIRKVLSEEINKLHKIDKERALKALSDAEKIRKSGVFNGGKTGAEIIREWRDKRR